MNKTATVVLRNSTKTFDKEYDYLIPEELTDAISEGMRVIVPFGKSNRPVEGYVFRIIKKSKIDNLKTIIKLIDKTPSLNEDLISLAVWMKKRYLCTYNDAIKCMLPPGTGIKSMRIVRLLNKSEIEDKNDETIVKTLENLDMECEINELKEKTDIKFFTKTINKLVKLGAVEIENSYSSGVKEKMVQAAYLNIPVIEAQDLVEGNALKNIGQIRIIEMLIENEYLPVRDMIRFLGVSRSSVESLSKRGVIDLREIEINREPGGDRVYENTEPLIMNLEQKNVTEELIKGFDEEKLNEYLLHGVTGSGKTEIYMQLIKYCCDLGKQSIVLVPEISLTPQMIERFKGRFGNKVAVIHSRLSLGERFDQWRLIRDEKVDIVVGARSAVFAPFKKLGLVIIDEEHENTYKSEITPRYHAREIAKERLKGKNAILLYGSATPSVETYFDALNGSIKMLKMNLRANKMMMPAMETIDMRNELENGNRSMFSESLIKELIDNIENKQQAILFLNKRGSASFVLCRACGLVMRCPNCSISLTYHSHDERLICHYCGYTVKNPAKCPKCSSDYIRHFGTGTQKVEESIKKQFPKASVIRMDMDTTTGKNSHEEILKSFVKNNINILIGTQMIAKGHDFPNVTLVGVLAADSLLNTGDFRASERTFQLITQVSGRAGRGKIPGRVIIQTYNTEDFSIVSACNNDYNAFYKKEISIRESLNYPPFTNVAIIIVSGTIDKKVYETACAIKMELSSGTLEKEGVEVLGPARSPLSKIKNKYRWRIVIKCKDTDKILEIFENISSKFDKKNKTDNVTVSMDINPVNML